MNNKGSISVFLVFILTAMIALTAAFIYASRETAVRGFGDGVLNLALQSVLSEFDLSLKERYHLFALEKRNDEVRNDIEAYAEYAFSESNTASLDETQVWMGKYSLADQDILRKQILDYMRFAAAKNLIQKKEEHHEEKQEHKDRTLRNRQIIRALPSIPWREYDPGFLEWVGQLPSGMGSLSEIFDMTKETYLIDRYIMMHFRNSTKGSFEYESFFDEEVEYILGGSYSNKENREKVQDGLEILRSVFNSVFLYTDPEKRAETLAAAEIMTPGPAAVVTQAVIIGTWSMAEAKNDTALLLRGKPVMLFKDQLSWATDLQAVLANRRKDCIDTGDKRGWYYEDYLMLFLHFQNEKIKLARVADLIQINMKGTINRNFLIQTENSGIHLKAEINHREYEYNAKY